MRPFNISSIGFVKPVREVILSWDPSKSALRRAAFAALLASAAASAAANVLVVRSAGPSAAAYPAGRSLPDNARINLRAGDTLIVLTAGGTRTFRGPGIFSPGAAVQAGNRAPSASADGRRARIGAVRNAGIVPSSPTIWHVDVTQSGTICLAGDEVTLWRPDSSAPLALTIVAPGSRPRTVSWPAGAATLAWPAGTPIVNGGAYSFRTPGVAVPTQIIFRTLPTEPADLQAVAAALIANGCQEQLDVLVETQPAEPAGS
jgi:hypothetical protein